MRSKASRVTSPPAPPLVQRSGTSAWLAAISFRKPAKANVVPLSHLLTSAP
jgi:hypothetical protein